MSPIRNGCRADRAAFWCSLGASPSETRELVAYTEPAFDFSDLPTALPLPDEPFVETWASYVQTAERLGVWDALRGSLLELRFPIERGISQTQAYRAATRRGEVEERPPGKATSCLIRPESLSLTLQQTPAGRIPVVCTRDRRDFETLVQALTRRNEPWPVPGSLGACTVVGYNNLGRIFQLRRAWQLASPQGSAADWQVRFREIAAQPDLYQDRFILLSSGPYSAVPAQELGLAEEDWNRRSHVIRLEHECTHYFTCRVLGSMRNALMDELIADYMGIVASEHRYRADWFLRFVGLEGFARYRPDGRLENYRGEPPLSDGAFVALQRAVVRAATNLEAIDLSQRSGRRPDGPSEKGWTIVTLARMSLEDLACTDAPRLFRDAWARDFLRTREPASAFDQITISS